MNAVYRKMSVVLLICLGFVLGGCTPLVEVPDSTFHSQRENLGYMEAHDDVMDETYAFRVYKETNVSTGDVMVKIKSNLVSGTSITPRFAKRKSLEAEEKGMRYLTIGRPFNSPGKRDPRKIEYRLYQKKGKPLFIEVFAVTRRDLHRGKKPKVLRVDWLN